MEYTKGKNIISKLMKSAISIGIFIILVVTIPYIAIFVIRALFFIAVFGVLAWYGFKLVKTIKSYIYKIRTKNDATIKSDISSNDTFTADSIDINYEDSTVIDVDYEKVE
ncbi:hypothetical protein [Clostridium sp.]|uniref:hypothetical protein n=1 Tax=Clostridium sp. TaxID=1506 RepID=UPI003D6D7BA7